MLKTLRLLVALLAIASFSASAFADGFIMPGDRARHYEPTPNRPLPPIIGGTGLSSPAANSVLLTYGAAAFQTVAPGSSGNVLTSNGTTWQSSAAPGITLATPVAATSGTSIDFTGIPSGTKTVTVMLSGVSLSGTALPVLRIGGAGGIETTGYLGSTGVLNGSSAATTNSTTYVVLNGAGSSSSLLYHATITLSLVDSTNNIWVITGIVGNSGAADIQWVSYSKTTSGALNRVRITTSNGTDTFAAGTINISYQH